MDISIVLPHRGASIGLWATIESCFNELSQTTFSFEFVVVHNGPKNEEDDTYAGVYDSFGKTKERDFINWLRYEQPLSPPAARNLGAEAARGDCLFFFDAHCIPFRGYFDRAMTALRREEVHVLHGTTTRVLHKALMEYHLMILLEQNFWGMKAIFPADPEHPYKIAIGDHGGFAVRKDVWKELGGYWDGFRHWGGEESYFSFKAWLMGKSVWLDPKMVFSHYWSEKRGYSKNNNDNYYLNMLMVANIVGGQKWLDTVSHSFSRSIRIMDKGEKKSPVSVLAQQAAAISAEHAEWFASVRRESLDDFLLNMDARGIAH